MPTELSSENQISRRMTDAGYSADFLAALAKIPPSRLSQAFRGIKPVGGPQGIPLLKLQDKIDDLIRLAAPLPLSWKNPAVIRSLITASEEGRLRITVENCQPGPKQDGFSIQMHNGQFFVRRIKDAETFKIVDSMNFMQGSLMTEEIADAILDLLEKTGHGGCKKVSNRFGDPIDDFRLWQTDADDLLATK
jgi:hypothetical protein